MASRVDTFVDTFFPPGKWGFVLGQVPYPWTLCVHNRYRTCALQAVLVLASGSHLAKLCAAVAVFYHPRFLLPLERPDAVDRDVHVVVVCIPVDGNEHVVAVEIVA